MTHYLFIIANTETNRKYIGVSKNAYSARDIHLRLLKAHNHFIKDFQQDYNTYGLSAINYLILDTSENKADMCGLACALIDDNPPEFYNIISTDIFLEGNR